LCIRELAGEIEKSKGGSYQQREEVFMQDGSLKIAARKGTDRSSLMNVGRRVDYAIRALSYLAAQPAHRITGSKEITQRQDIPSHYLSKIMKDLVAAGLIKSHVGCKGGFSLARKANAISLKEVYEAVEKPLVLMECLDRGDIFCRYDAVCTQISVWERAQGLLADYLARIPISSIADEAGLKGRLTGYR
jgi:Rrf2 family protein